MENSLKERTFTGKYFKVRDRRVSKDQVTYFNCLQTSVTKNGIRNPYKGQFEDIIHIDGIGFTVEADENGYISMFDVDLRLQISFNEFNDSIEIEEITKDVFDEQFLSYNNKTVEQMVSLNNAKNDFIDILNG